MDQAPVGDFGRLIEAGGPYADKTGGLAALVGKGSTARYLISPDGFGKTMTVSTLEALFNGRRDLFKGLAAEKFLDEPDFAPRPVLRLDMGSLDIGSVDTAAGLTRFRKDLDDYTRERARGLGVDLEPGLSADYDLYGIISKLGRGSPGGIAVLVDDYDALEVKYPDWSEPSDDIRRLMSNFYMPLKGLHHHISFTLATASGLNPYDGAPFSGVNHFARIYPDQSSKILGFTRKDLETRFGPLMAEAARKLQMTGDELMEELLALDHGQIPDDETFGDETFDDRPLVFNPRSTLAFLSNPRRRPSKPPRPEKKGRTGR